MRCGNCEFENMPGVTTCGRCGASLQLASLPIDVHPPRANRVVKRWRRWFPTTRYWNRFRAAAAGALATSPLTRRLADIQTPGVLARMIVPGWAQRRVGRVIRARWMFGCYLAFLLSGLLFIGTATGWILLGLAISLHAASILDIVAGSVVDLRRRLLDSVIAIIVLIAVLYYPAGRLVALVASPQQFNMAAAPFAAGDVVLVNPSAYRWSEPRPGDVVQYRLVSRDVPLRQGARQAVYRLQGDRIDRILAEAGQKVTWSHGTLLIDGQPSPWLPLNPGQLPEGLDITVPEGSYLIFPSTVALPPTEWQVASRIASIVSREQILGRAYWRSQPLWRFGPIH